MSGNIQNHIRIGQKSNGRNENVPVFLVFYSLGYFLFYSAFIPLFLDFAYLFNCSLLFRASYVVVKLLMLGFKALYFIISIN